MKTEKTDLDWFARAMLWSIRYQDRLSMLVRRCVYSAVVMVAGMGLLNLIPVETALRLTFYGGLTISCALWVFIDRRRAWLLGIRNPDLREHAHQTMLAYLAARGHRLETRHPMPVEVEADRTNECSDC